MTKSVEQVRVAQAKGFGNIPLFVLSAEHEEYPEWSELQAQTASLSSDGKHIVVKDASHYIHKDEPQIVIDSIMSMIKNTIG